MGLSVTAIVLLAATDQYEIGAGFGRNAVSNSPVADYNFFNLRAGKYLDKNHILRFELEKSEKFGSGDNVKNEHLLRGLLNVEHYFIFEDSKLAPYAFAGAGYQWISGNYDNNVVADLGIGLKYFINSNINAFAELRGLRDFGNDDNHYGVIFGISYSFGKEKVSKQEIKQRIKNITDTDGDGVAENMDKCPNTPKGVSVDKEGCQTDSDSDGVYDNVDKCADTPENVSVDVNGCPADSDNDGVADYKDKCPDTLKGVKVDKNGCAAVYDFHLTFDNNSAKIKDNFISKIKKLAEFLKQNPSYKVEIQGYTDNKGSAKYNQKLSEHRAKAVYETLIKLGVKKERLSYKGYGEENPVASNDIKKGRLENRRVIAKIYVK
jgi:OOP family OmpA-OmpF porin